MSNPYAPPQPPPPPAEGEERPQTPPAPWPPAPHPTAPPHVQHGGPRPVGPHGHPAPPGPGRRRDERPADEAGVAHARRLARLFAVLVLAGALTGTFPLPWSAASLVFAVAAVAVGVRALVVAVRARARGSLPALLGVGVAAATGWMVISFGLILLWPLQSDRQDCLAGALTLTARQQCEQQFEDGLDDWRTDLEERTRR